MLSTQTVGTVQYRGYDIEIRKRNDWQFDDDLPRNVLHHLLSLRWLGDFPPQKKHVIAEDFIRYHNSSENVSRFYLGRAADHTASIRLRVLLELEKSSANRKRKNAYFQEAVKTIRSMLAGDTYKAKNNHGLSVDIALLRAFKDWRLREMFNNGLRLAAERAMMQFSHIFDAGGVTREHSIGYQEFNAVLAKELLEAISESPLQDNSLAERVERILDASKAVLGYALTSGGGYIPLGDSPREPNNGRLKRIFGNETSFSALAPYCDQDGMMVAPHGGFCFIRSGALHAAITASWHSYVHKQDDDLATSIIVNGKTFIDDAGHPGINQAPIAKSVDGHSTITVEGARWLRKADCTEGQSCIRAIVSQTEVKGVWCRHTRMAGFMVERFLGRTSAGSLLLMDRVFPKTTSRHRFILGPHVYASIDGRSVTISDGTDELNILADGLGEWRRSETEVVYGSEVRRVLALDFLTNGSATFFADIIRLTHSCDFPTEALNWPEDHPFEGWKIYGFS